MGRLIGYFGLGVIAAGLCQPTHANSLAAPEELHPMISDSYYHRAWTPKEGAPSGIWTLAQSTDGWLWLGCATGLYRFDGISFERVELVDADSLESRSVRYVSAASGGGLWVVLASGRTAFISDPTRVVPTWLAGMPTAERVDSMDEDGNGTFWAFSASNKAFVIENSRAHSPEATWMYPEGEIKGTLIDARGDYWVRTSSALAVLHHGSKTFEKASATDWPDDALLHTSQKGELWLTDETNYGLAGTHSAIPKGPSESPWSRKSADGTLLTREGSWWTVNCPKGICRGWPSSYGRQRAIEEFAADTFAHREGLSSDRAMILFEDMEGNIWVGTKQGLDQFHRNAFTKVTFPTPVNYLVMAADQHEGIWSGSTTDYSGIEDSLWRIIAKPAKVPGFSGALGAVFEGSDGSLLWGGHDAIWLLKDGQMKRSTTTATLPHGSIRTLARDNKGNLWASFSGKGTYQLTSSGWVLGGGGPAVHDEMATAAARDEAGTLWLGFKDNAVTRLQGGQALTFTQKDGLDIGPVNAIGAGEQTLFGGEFGLDLFVGGRFVALHGDQPQRMKGISGIVRARDGDLWLNGRNGAVRVNSEDFNHAVHDPGYTMPLHAYDAEDGLPAGAVQAVGAPSIVQDKQGKLWFATEDGLAWLEPEKQPSASAAPLVEILSLSTPQGVVRAGAGITLPPGSRNVAIKYTALNLTHPGRIQFRFRLSGVDAEWRDMGAERLANYSNLSPGSYQAQVLASTDSGDWSGTPATLSFSIRAAFYQTPWFKAICLAALVIALVGIGRLLSFRAASLAAARIGDRMLERERIARELHDTLLQDVQALRLNLRALHMSHGGNSPVGPALEQLEQAAAQSLAQARARVGGLRSGDSTNLTELLKEFGEQMAALYPATLKVETKGAATRLHPVAADEIIAIGREALLNAFRHAQAKTISVSISYSKQALELIIVDDGAGFEFGTHDETPPGHFGIVGMRERASGLKAVLLIRSQLGIGTKVSLRIPAATAFYAS